MKNRRRNRGNGKNDLIKPGGMFISATDRLAESGLAYRMLPRLMRIFSLPYVKLYTKESLKSAVALGGFDLVETCSLYETPPNLFITARKK